jgi:mannose-6-phosphate isomerase-like protein (cupin superfamily)
MTEQIYEGNAAADAPAGRGWLLGHFQPAGDPRHSDEVEIKWAIHPVGDRRGQWVTGERRSAALILVSGRFRVEFPGRSVLLAQQGDYVVFHGVNHSWHAEEASVVVAVRWATGLARPARTLRQLGGSVRYEARPARRTVCGYWSVLRWMAARPWSPAGTRGWARRLPPPSGRRAPRS